MLRAIISFSTKPLDLIAIIGVIIVTMGVCLFIYLLLCYISVGRSPAGFMMIVSTQLLGFGSLILFQGIVAQYIKVIFHETKDRPTAIIKLDEWI